MTDTEPRRIKKIVREPAVDPFPDVPAGQSRRGAIMTQTVEVLPHSIPRVVAGYVTLPQLAAQLNMQAQLARLWVKAAGIKKPADGRWRWKEGSRELSRVRKALGLDK